MSREVNIPLLRKAVEWAEAEAAKPPELCEWSQADWVLPTPSEASDWGWETSEALEGRADTGKAVECGTCYCIAGFIVSQTSGPIAGGSIARAAAEALGLPESDGYHDHPLFHASNTIEDVRRIAEDIAGERL